MDKRRGSLGLFFLTNEKIGFTYLWGVWYKFIKGTIKMNHSEFVSLAMIIEKEGKNCLKKKKIVVQMKN
jgi:hypothetical protein